MNKKMRKLLVAALVVSMILTQMLGITAFAAPTSYAGADRYATALKISATYASADTVVLANGEEPADALSASPYAYSVKAPILLTGTASLPDGVLAELARLKVKTVVIAGGTGAVSQAVEDSLKTAGYTIDRVSGADRYATSLAFAKKLGTTANGVVIANGYAFADALSIAPIAAFKGMPIVLTAKDALSADAAAFVTGKTGYIVGGTAVVGEVVTGATRLAGDDRYATNDKIIENFASDLDFSNIYLATGENGADALAGSVVAAGVKAPLVLVGSALNDAVKTFLAAKVTSSTKFFVLGGASSVLAAEAALEPSAPPTSVGVQSVTAIGLNEIKVVFAQQVDETSAEDVSHYQMDGIALTPGQDSAYLAGDYKTLTIYLYNQKPQNSTSLFTIKDKTVLSYDTLTAVPKAETTLTFSDVAAPQVTEVGVTGNSQIYVTFDKLVDIKNLMTQAGSLFKIDGQSVNNYGYSGSEVDSGSTTPTSKVYADGIDLDFSVALPAGSHTLTIPKGTAPTVGSPYGYTAGGFSLAETTMNFTVESVTDAPQVTNITGDTNGTVYVTYNRAMDGSTGNNTTYVNGSGVIGYYSVVGSTKATGFTQTASFKSGTGHTVVKLVFGPNYVKEGTNVLVITKNIQDAWGNKITTNDDVRYSFTATKDTTKPTVTAVTVMDKNTIRVKFSKSVNPTYAQNAANYTLKNADGVTQTINSTIAKNADDTYTLNISANPYTGTGWTLKIKNIIDTASPANVMDDYVANITGIDDVAPTVSSVVKVDDSTVGVYFSEAMDVASISTLSNYAYIDSAATTGTTRSIPSSASITVGDDNKSVQIKFPTGYKVLDSTTNWSLAANQSTYYIKDFRVSNVADVAGNIIDGIAYLTSPTNAGAILLASSATTGNPDYVGNSFTLSYDGTKVVAKFNLTQALSTFDYTDFRVQGTTATSGYLSGKTVVLNYGSQPGIKNIKNAGIAAQLTVVGNNSENSLGVPVKMFSAQTVYDDQMAPELQQIYATTSTTSVTLKFSEPIDLSIAGSYADNFTFAVGGKVLSVSSVTTSNTPANTVQFNFAAGSFTTGDNIVVTAVSSKVKILDVEDAYGDQNLYVPTSDDISGYTITADTHTSGSPLDVNASVWK